MNKSHPKTRVFGFVFSLYGLLCFTCLSNPAYPSDVLASACFSCHGQNGNSSSPLVPSLAGQQAGYLSNQITAFRDNTRVNPIMATQVKQLSNADITRLANEFSKHTTQKTGGNATLAKQGANKAVQCSGCHAADFSGHGMIPKLRSQQAAYLAKQLRHFKDGSRKSGPMQAIAAQLTDNDMEQLAAYFSSL